MPSQCSVREVGVEIGVFRVGCMILWLDGILNTSLSKSAAKETTDTEFT